MVKIACGQYFAVGAKERIRISKTHTIDLEKVRRAFFDRSWDPRCGLYFSGDVGTRVTLDHNISIIPLTVDAEQRFCGTRIFLHGFGFECLFDNRGANPGPWKGISRRPTEIVLQRRERERHIIVTWPHGTPENCVVLKAF